MDRLLSAALQMVGFPFGQHRRANAYSYWNMEVISFDNIAELFSFLSGHIVQAVAVRALCFNKKHATQR